MAYIVITTSGRRNCTRELDTVATETVSEVDMELNMKIKRIKVFELESDKHATCHFE